MELASVRSLVVDLPGLPCFHKGYVRCADRKVFWTIHQAHHALQQQGLTIKLNKFVATVDKAVRDVGFANITLDVRKRPPGDADGLVPFNIASTVTILAYAAAGISFNQTKAPIKSSLASWVSAAVRLALETMGHQASSSSGPVSNVDLGHSGMSLQVFPNSGIVRGWGDFIWTLRAKTRALWTEFQASEGSPETTMLLDVVMFLCKCRRLAAVSPGCRVALDTVLEQLLVAVTKHVDEYVVVLYPLTHGARSSIPDVLRSGGRVKGGGVDAETAWQVLERANEVYGATPELVIAVKSDEDAFRGLSARTGSKCTAREKLRWQPGLALLCLSACVLRAAEANHAKTHLT